MLEREVLEVGVRKEVLAALRVSRPYADCRRCSRVLVG